jgi:multidrug resistance efflux pump
VKDDVGRHRPGIIIAVALIASGCGLHGKPSVDRSKALAYAHPAPSPSGPPDLAEPERVVAPGIVEAWGGNIELSPQESGWIATLLVEEGDRVDAGQTLAVLDDAAQHAAVDLAQADLAEVEATRAKTLRGATTEELRERRADAEAARARSRLAESDARRASKLGRESALAPAEVDRVIAESTAQLAVASAAEARLAGLERGARGEDRSASNDRVASAQARLDLSRANLERRRVVAPVAATVLLDRRHPGEFFTVGGAPLLVLGDTSRLQVRLEVDEIDAFRVREGAGCTLYGDDNRKIVAGTVFRIAPQMGRRGLAIESPTARADVRVREVFVEASGASGLIPGQRVWGHLVPTRPPDTRLTAVEDSHDP